MWIWPGFKRKWKSEAKGLHRLQRQHFIERKRNLDSARKSFSEIVFFSLCCYARVWEIESVRSNKCNESSCQNNTNTLNFFCFITAIAHKPVCNTAQLGITFMNCRPQKKVQSQIWISGWLTHYSKAFYGDFVTADRSNISSTVSRLHSKFDSYLKWTGFSRKKTTNLSEIIDLIWINVQKVSMLFHPFDIHGKLVDFLCLPVKNNIFFKDLNTLN